LGVIWEICSEFGPRRVLNKPATSRSPSPNKAISSPDGMDIVPTPGSCFCRSRRSPSDLKGSRNCSLVASVPVEKRRGVWFGATGEKLLLARLNAVLTCAVVVGPTTNSDVSCDVDSTPAVEREVDRFFLRAGRIQGGRAEHTVSSWGMVGLSSGICVTKSSIRPGEVASTYAHTPAKLFHHITGALTTYVTTTESA
jgi:hypothetical protein